MVDLFHVLFLTYLKTEYNWQADNPFSVGAVFRRHNDS